jgi:hypothetical protein
MCIWILCQGISGTWSASLEILMLQFFSSIRSCHASMSFDVAKYDWMFKSSGSCERFLFSSVQWDKIQTNVSNSSERTTPKSIKINILAFRSCCLCEFTHMPRVLEWDMESIGSTLTLGVCKNGGVWHENDELAVTVTSIGFFYCEDLTEVVTFTKGLNGQFNGPEFIFLFWDWPFLNLFFPSRGQPRCSKIIIMITD